MKVYHGSYTTIDEIDLSKAVANKDFGKGFYVTKFRHQAETWAEIIGSKHDTEGCVTEFEYTETEFTKSVCKIKHFEDYSEEWLDFVVMNRDKRNPDPAHDYDIVEGPVADDKVQTKIVDYLKGTMSKAKFLEELTWHEQTHQICFCTVQSLQMIERPGSVVAGDGDLEYHIKNIGEPLLERLMLDAGMDEVQATDAFYTSDTFARLADATTGLHLRPWEEIYDLLRKELKI
jgi:hypothetical protein